MLWDQQFTRKYYADITAQSVELLRVFELQEMADVFHQCRIKIRILTIAFDVGRRRHHRGHRVDGANRHAGIRKQGREIEVAEIA